MNGHESCRREVAAPRPFKEDTHVLYCLIPLCHKCGQFFARAVRWKKRAARFDPRYGIGVIWEHREGIRARPCASACCLPAPRLLDAGAELGVGRDAAYGLNGFRSLTVIALDGGNQEVQAPRQAVSAMALRSTSQNHSSAPARRRVSRAARASGVRSSARAKAASAECRRLLKAFGHEGMAEIPSSESSAM